MATEQQAQGTAIAEYSAKEKAMLDLRQKYKGVLFDTSTTKGMADARAARGHIREVRLTLEETRVGIKAPALERCRLIDAEAKRIREELEALEDPIALQIKTEDDRKEREKLEKLNADINRKAKLQREVEWIGSYVIAHSSDSIDELGAAIGAVEVIDVGNRFEEFQPLAIQAKEAALSRLNELRTIAIERAAEDERIKEERAELARLRAADEARRKQEDLDRAERNRVAAVELERIEAEANERRRVADEAAAAERVRQSEAARIERDRQAQIEMNRIAERQAEEARQAAEIKARQEAQADELRKERAKIDAEKIRIAEESAARVEREIASATVESAATDALTFLRELGYSDHVVVKKLERALQP